jgi:hypothetical protein
MAKNESTAVNELISSVQSRAIAPQSSPGDDLFSAPQRTSVIPATNTLNPASTTLGMSPLPRSRTPSGTRENVLNPALPAPPPRPATVTGAPALPAPTRAVTAPPIRPATLAGGTPPPELIVPPTAPTRTPPGATLQGMSPLAPPPARPAAAAMPVAAIAAPPPASASLVPAPPIVAPAPLPRPSVPNGHNGHNGHVAIDHTGDAVAADGWFEASRAVDRVDIDQDDISGTLPVQRQPARGNKTHKMIAWGVVGAVAVVMLVGYVMFDGSGGKHKAQASTRTASADTANAATGSAADKAAQPTAEQIAQPGNGRSAETAGAPSPSAPAAAAPSAEAAPAAAPTAAAPASSDTAAAPSNNTPAAPGKLVDVRIDSKPAGATVMLVDNGKTSFLGTTPVSATVDPSRMYDVIFTLEGQPTQMLHLDAKHTNHLALTFGRGGAPIAANAIAATTTPAAPAVAAPAKATPAPAPAVASQPAQSHSAPAHHHSAPARTAAAEPVSSDGRGSGTLMVSSKPPCEIWIDGKSTGLTTPQRAIPLSAGSHKVTFVNSSSNIHKTVPVAIKADQPTKLIQNLMQ